MSETVGDLQKFITQELDLEVRYQRLVCMGRELKDPFQILGNIINKNNPIVHLYMRVHGG